MVGGDANRVSSDHNFAFCQEKNTTMVIIRPTKRGVFCRNVVSLCENERV